MGEGLAQTMVYGSGEGNTITHHYAGDKAGQCKRIPKIKMASKKRDKLKGKMQTTELRGRS